MDNGKITADRLPSKYRPLGMWEYFAYSILFVVPVVGFVFLVIYSLDGSNINRRNYARSFFCSATLPITFIVILASAGILGLVFSKFIPDGGSTAMTILNTIL